MIGKSSPDDKASLANTDSTAFWRFSVFNWTSVEVHRWGINAQPSTFFKHSVNRIQLSYFESLISSRRNLKDLKRCSVLKDIDSGDSVVPRQLHQNRSQWRDPRAMLARSKIDHELLPFTKFDSQFVNQRERN